ncbi:MAG: DUF2752 domain-containing protein [Ruminococcus sp.]|nr:DUF2752 domain-containing protein [Ruminococcus sp.]
MQYHQSCSGNTCNCFRNLAHGNDLMRETSKKISAGLAAVIPPLVLLLFFQRKQLIKLTDFFPECYFYKLTGYLCPACGNTRSITSLLNGQILLSLGYNITPFIIVILLTAFYIELAAHAFGRKISIIPRRYSFLALLLLFISIYYAARNFIPSLTLCI